MKKFFHIAAIKGVGRYRVVISHPEEAQSQIKNFLLSGNYDSLVVTNKLISFSLDVHENFEEVIRGIEKIYDTVIAKRKLDFWTKIINFLRQKFDFLC